MQAFALLYAELDKTTSTNRKIDALVAYLRQSPAADAAWAIHFLIGRRPKRAMSSRKLAQWAAEAAGVPGWLFEACYHTVGDLAETIALLLPESDQNTTTPLHAWVEEHLLPLNALNEPARRQAVLSAWQQMNTTQRLVWNKLITGAFRIGVSQRLVTRALARFSGAEPALIAHRLMGAWTPSADFFEALISRQDRGGGHSRPYPFYLAYPLDRPVESLGEPPDWLAEWKWDGIRAQVLKRRGEVFIWSRGEDLVTAAFPELSRAARALPDGCGLDGEIVAFRDGAPMGFAALQRRLGRKHIDARIMQAAPVALIAYDLLEYDGRNIRDRPLVERRSQLARLVALLADRRIRLSPSVPAGDWEAMAAAVEQARARGVEGLMLKRSNSPSRACRLPIGTSRASRCVSRASRAGGATKPLRRPTPWPASGPC